MGVTPYYGLHVILTGMEEVLVRWTITGVIPYYWLLVILLGIYFRQARITVVITLSGVGRYSCCNFAKK